jgi:16S rRNA (guanine527-N7)-methyltransferase
MSIAPFLSADSFLLLSFAKENKLELPETFMEKISQFCEILLEANKTTNLVSKNDSQKLLTRHVADSLIFATHVVPVQQWTDIGAGAGFPAVPLCLYFKNVQFYAVECRKKRCEFLEKAKQKLNLQNLEIIHGKAESSNLKNMDVVSCRAVGSLEEDFERAKKLLKISGHFLTLKSKRNIDELKAKKDTLLKQAKVWSYRLPGEELEYAFMSLPFRCK